MSTEQERIEARVLLATHVGEAITAAMKASPNPLVVWAAVPMTLAGLAGSFTLQLLRARIVGDGQVDQLMDLLNATMRDHANPALNPPTGMEVPPNETLKGAFKP